MSDTQLQKLSDVSVVLKANVYFDGKVVSHTVLSANGSKKTIGLIYPGSYKFDTGAPERMDIIAGSCRIRIGTQEKWEAYPAGTFFLVPGNSFFEIRVDEGIAEYLCSFE